jgi:hypothetical protein
MIEVDDGVVGQPRGRFSSAQQGGERLTSGLLTGNEQG